MLQNMSTVKIMLKKHADIMLTYLTSICSEKPKNKQNKMCACIILKTDKLEKRQIFETQKY